MCIKIPLPALPPPPSYVCVLAWRLPPVCGMEGRERAPLLCRWLELHLWSFNMTKRMRQKCRFSISVGAVSLLSLCPPDTCFQTCWRITAPPGYQCSCFRGLTAKQKIPGEKAVLQHPAAERLNHRLCWCVCEIGNVGLKRQRCWRCPKMNTHNTEKRMEDLDSESPHFSWVHFKPFYCKKVQQSVSD